MKNRREERSMGVIAGAGTEITGAEVEARGAETAEAPLKVSPVTITAAALLVLVMLGVHLVEHPQRRIARFVSATSVGRPWVEAEAELKEAGFQIVPELHRPGNLTYRVDVLPRYGQLRMWLYRALGGNPNFYKYLQIIPRYRTAVVVNSKGKIISINRW